MNARLHALMTGIVLTGLGACGGAPSSSFPAPHPTAAPSLPTSPSPVAAPPSPGCAEPRATPPPASFGAAFATSLAFAPDGRLFYAERAGTVRVWQDGGPHRFASVATVTSEPGGGYSERGLLGLAISPTYNGDHFVYALYSDADYQHQRVVRWRDCGGTGVEAALLVSLPSGPDCCHKGGRIAFGPDGKLYISVGEQHEASAAQVTADVRGKILRYNPDGTVPGDNPFGTANPVWAFGFRNPYGLAFAANGRLAVTSNGPTGDAGSPPTGYDTVIVSTVRGGGYQWPLCYGYGHPLTVAGCGAGEHGPDWSSEAGTVVPAGATFVDSAGPVQEAGHLVFCTFNKGMLILTPAPGHATVTSGPSECRLDVKQGPDHSLVYSDETHIHRLP